MATRAARETAALANVALFYALARVLAVRAGSQNGYIARTRMLPSPHHRSSFLLHAACLPPSRAVRAAPFPLPHAALLPRLLMPVYTLRNADASSHSCRASAHAGVTAWRVNPLRNTKHRARIFCCGAPAARCDWRSAAAMPRAAPWVWQNETAT